MKGLGVAPTLLMRTLLKASMDVHAANDLIQKGEMQKFMKSMTDLLKPEASYFYAEHGKRTALYVFDLKDPSQIPMIAEPFFTMLKAEIEFHPVMNQEDVAKGLDSYKGKLKAA